MRKSLMLLLVLLLIIPVMAKQNVGFGFTIGSDSSGIIFLLPSKSRINPEIVTSGYISDSYYNLLFGGRILWDLGKKGIVDRYVGAGVGVFFTSIYEADSYKQDNSFWGQALLGTKVAWQIPFLAAPIKFRNEIGFDLHNKHNNLNAATYVSLGLEYEF